MSYQNNDRSNIDIDTLLCDVLCDLNDLKHEIKEMSDSKRNETIELISKTVELIKARLQ